MRLIRAEGIRYLNKLARRICIWKTHFNILSILKDPVNPVNPVDNNPPITA